VATGRYHAGQKVAGEWRHNLNRHRADYPPIGGALRIESASGMLAHDAGLALLLVSLDLVVGSSGSDPGPGPPS
jgi:hypothetical protein